MIYEQFTLINSAYVLHVIDYEGFFFFRGKGITETMMLLSILIAFVNDTDVNVSCLNQKPQSFYWDEIQLQIFVSNEDTVLEGAPVKTIVKEKRIYIIVSVVLENRHYMREIFTYRQYIYICTIRT